LNARQATAAVMRDLWRKETCVPNYTPAGWYECDVFRVTRAGYWHEFEVKLTVADFNRDRDKVRETWRRASDGWSKAADVLTKHQRLAGGDTTGPSRFWFAAPAALRIEPHVPSWAGLVYLHEQGARVVARIARQAPELHRVKVDEKVVAHARGVLYYRFHRLAEQFERLRSKSTAKS
jgi:hypothetical protein